MSFNPALPGFTRLSNILCHVKSQRQPRVPILLPISWITSRKITLGQVKMATLHKVTRLISAPR